MHISTVSAIRNIQQEGAQRVARLRILGGALWVPSLPTRETKRIVGEGAFEPIARETTSKRERVITHDLGQISANLMTVRRLRNVGDVLSAAGVAADSRTRDERGTSRSSESADESTGKTDGREQVGGGVREASRRVVLICGPCVLNLKHET